MFVMGKIECAECRLFLCEEYLQRLIDISTEADDDSYLKFHKDDPEGKFYSNLSNMLDYVISVVRDHRHLLFEEWDRELDAVPSDFQEAANE